MKYRAELVDVPNLERPLQILGMNLNNILDWAAKITANNKRGYPTGRVLIYELKEELIYEVKGEQYAEKDAQQNISK